MAGSISPGASERAGTVREPFSKDGSHLVFGSTAQLEPAANSNGTDATIYSRDLGAGTSEVISTLPDGTTIQGGPDVAELGISVDGTKTVVGELLSTDAEGNHRYHLYLHQRGIAGSTDLMPGATEGATYAGMTADGQSVYFTTLDPLGTNADQDTDGSADLYRAEVEGSTASLTRVSVGSGGTGDSDACDPAPNSFGAHWNGVGAKADCSVAAVAGGGGVASQDGSIFFLSPEQLDGSRGTQDEPNLYLSEPGGAPHFIATLESKTTGASPLPTQHPFTTSFGSFSLPQSIAVDQSAGYVYVLDVTAGAVKRFDTEGNPANFAAGPNAGTNALTGFTFVIGSSTGQIAVDNSGGANNGDLYVTNNSTALPVVKVISRTGAALGQLAGSSTPEGNFGGETGALRYPTGVAVGPTGALYVAGGASGKVYRYVPSTSPVAESDYQATLNYGDANNVAGQISADSAGNLYAIKLNSSGFLAGTGLSKYAASQFGQAGAQAGAAIDVAATASYVDPISDYLYASRGTTAAEYTPSGELQDVFGAGRLTASKGIAVLGSTAAADSRIFASSTTGAKNVSVFDARPAPSALVDNPLVAHAVHATDRQSNGDLQVTPQGSVALFDATLPLTGFFSARKEEIFRYDRGSDSLLCVSCSPNGATPEQGTTLARYGRNLSDDGRVFFTTSEPLALGDSNERKDAYEWEAGTQQLISTGTSPEDSSLLTVSADGRNALFFTRQQLVQEDQNGNAVRLYTAREDGGFVHGPPSFECAASDECHGAGSKPPSPASIGTLGGAPGQFGAAANAGRCAKGKVRRRGRCVKKPPKRHAHKRNHSARGGRG
jgi:hypothetical protein